MNKDKMKAFISETLMVRALATIEEITEAANDTKHHKHFGKIGIVDRVRAGKVQLRKKKSDAKGFKVHNGVIVKMDPSEVRKRKIAGRITARKLRGKQAQILRKRSISLNIGGARLGEESGSAE